MNLSDLQKGECGKIVSISSDSVLKSRFSSFGITRGATIYVLEYTIAKNTMEVKINNTKIALRLTEAKFIEIEQTECKI